MSLTFGTICNVADRDMEDRVNAACERIEPNLVDCSLCKYFATTSCVELDHYCVADLDMK